MLRLHVCDTTYNFSDRIEDSYLFGFSWNVGFNWPPGITRTLRLSLPPNRAATGAPVISGTAQVGEELTALTDGIMDEDGLDNVFNYQWGRMDGTNETDLPDATSGTYTLTRDDVGKTLKVRVSFTDLLDSKETRPSQGFFLPNTAPTAADNAVMTDEDTAYTFTASDFSFADADGDTIASLPTAGTLVLDDTAVTLGQSVPAADIGKLRFTPTANDSGDAYASFTFRVSDGTEESASAYTMTVNVTAMNDPATGAPTISGTAQVGQTLTAATAGIADVDGLTSPTYSYQWIRVDGADETNIGGATSATYTPVQDDVGKALKVRAGFAEKRTSAPTAAVTAAPATCPAPDFAGRRKIWTGVLTLGDFTYSPASYRGYGRFPDAGGDGGGLDPATFTVGSNEHEVEILALGTRLDFALRAGTGWRDTNAAALRLHVCNANFDFSDSNFTVDGPSGIVFPFHSWDTDLDWSSVSTRTVHLNLPQNRAATGAPAITGTAEAGLYDAVYTYQWVRVDADGTSNEEDISGATAATYTLTDDDLGKKVKVEVSFTDDFGNVEQRTSAPTATVTAAAEGDAITFTVTLTPAATQEVTVDYATSVAASDTAAQTDFTAGIGTLIFAVDEIQQTFTVSTLEDRIDEPDATGTIIDDDNAPVLVLSVDSASIAEDGGTSTGTGSTFPDDRTITLALTGTATETDDYTISWKSLTLPAGVGSGASSVTATVTAVDDELSEGGETVLIDAALGTGDMAAAVGTRQTLTIIDNDRPCHRRAGDQRHGAGRDGADRLAGHHRRRRRPGRCQLQLPVDSGGRRGRDGYRGGEHGQLHAGGGGRGQDPQSESELHRQRGLRRATHQRGDGDGDRRQQGPDGVGCVGCVGNNRRGHGLHVRGGRLQLRRHRHRRCAGARRRAGYGEPGGA